MNKIKVYLQYPWSFQDSPYYKYLTQNPPTGGDYVNITEDKGAIISKNKFLLLNRTKRITRFLTKISKAPLINTKKTDEKETCDLIHCAHCLSSNKNKPWVADFEGGWQMSVSGEITPLIKKRIKNILLNKNCKKILPWTENTKKQILIFFPEIKDKVEILYPAVPLQKKSKKETKKVTIIYNSRYFWLKGGLIALEVLRRLKKKYDIEIIFVSDVPEEIKKEYKEINIRDLVPQKELFDYYSKSDIFLYPCLCETFGFALLEAMSFGLSIVSVNTDRTETRKEIIQNGKNGFLIEVKEKMPKKDFKNVNKNEELVRKIVEKTSKIIEDKKLREKFRRHNIEMIKNGRFSIKKRNKKLKKIYEEAIEDE